MYGQPVAWIAVGAEGRGVHAEASLRTVLGYVGATIVDAAVCRVTVTRTDLDAAGDIVRGDVRAHIQQAVGAFAATLESVSQ